MGASMEYMTNYVCNAYESDRWRLKVQQMKPNQVAAIYHSLINRKTKKRIEKRANSSLSLLPQDPYTNYRQITIFDILEEN